MKIFFGLCNFFSKYVERGNFYVERARGLDKRKGKSYNNNIWKRVFI